jgi:hypothetical protein
LIRVRVQHHPSRAHLLPALFDSLKPLPIEVIEHSSDPPSPWAGYKLCMENPPDCDHLLIVQDDAMPVVGIVDVLGIVARDVPVCLYLARFPRDTKPRVEQAMKMGRRYIRLSQRSFMPIVAVLWPIAKLVEFNEWGIENPHLPAQREPRSDDAMAGRWKMITRQEVLATVPSLVEHPDREPSTIGKTAMWGNDRGRCAQFLAGDAREYDWTMP